MLRKNEEKQRRAIAEAKKQAEKFSTENLIKLPLQADFPMQEKKQEWEDITNQYIKDNMWTFKRVRRCTTSEYCNALGVLG